MSEETGSRVIWVEVVGGITVFGGILSGMMAGTFGGLMADASESATCLSRFSRCHMLIEI